MTRLSPIALLALLLCGLTACAGETRTAGSESDASASADAELPADTDASGDASTPDDDDGGDPSDSGDGAIEPTSLVLQSVSPSRGPAAGGTTLVLSGSGFFKSFASGATAAQADTTVLVADRPAIELVLINDLYLEAKAPPATEGQLGAVDVVLRNPSGEARCEGCFTYYEPIALDAIAPAVGSTEGGELVELTGKGFGGGLSVLFGERPATHVELLDDGRARVRTPPAASEGSVVVQAFNENGLATRIGAFRYESPLALDAIAPRAVPLTGDVEIELTGKALDEISALSVDDRPVPFSIVSATSLRFLAPPRAQSGVVPVKAEAQGSGVQAWLDGGLLYVDPDFSASEEGEAPFQIVGLWPTHGPADASSVVHVFGAHLDEIAAVWIDDRPIDFESDDALRLTLPPGQANHWATLRFEDAEGRARLLERAFRYDVKLDAVSPASGLADDWIELGGEGFDEGTTFGVRFGGLDAIEVERLSHTALRARAPAGNGLVDVTVFERADPTNADALAGGFTFMAPLAIATVAPASGTIAGGDEVSIYGSGFAPGMTVLFGTSTLRDVAIVSPSRLVGRVPPGRVGSVDVSVHLGNASDALAGGYTYRDASANLGGSTGGAIAGTLNVTVFWTSTQGIADVRVTASANGEVTPLASGYTNADGQLTLQSPGFNRPLRVTFEKAGFQTLVVENQSSANLAVFLTQMSSSASVGGSDSSPGGSSEGGTSSLPSGSTASGGSTTAPDYSLGSSTQVISGTVTGFKLPRPLGPDELAMAEVWTVPSSYYLLPPFGAATAPSTRDAIGERWRVTSDGGPFTIYGTPGLQSLYAVFGIYDTQTQILTPHLMGLLRNVAVGPNTPAVNLDIRLDMHLDQTLPVTVLPEPAALDPEDPVEAGRVLTHSVHAWLALGNDGYVGFGPTTGTTGALSMTGLPRLDAQNFLFLNKSTSADNAFTSYCYQQSAGALNGGVTVGPMLGRLIPIGPSEPLGSIEPSDPTAPIELLFDGTLRWRFEGGVGSDLLRLNIWIFHAGAGFETLEVVLPGTSTEFTLPAALAASIDPAMDTLSVSFQAARAPRFDYDFWSYSHFNMSSQSCWASGSFQVPLRRVPELEAPEPEPESP
ncbi:MAG: IPT/TIG domain-containing protein [Myxococcales bacterium]|jgi:hypothetical protein|nr:IPT/TIG domain-containing protein [Myxococcales bacterium]